MTDGHGNQKYEVSLEPPRGVRIQVLLTAKALRRFKRAKRNRRDLEVYSIRRRSRMK